MCIIYLFGDTDDTDDTSTLVMMTIILKYLFLIYFFLYIFKLMKIIISIILTLTTLHSFAQSSKKQADNISTKNDSAFTYRLYPTENLWTVIKLNTRNGQMWQVQFDVKGTNRFVTHLSFELLVSKEQEVNNRFTLYSTQNMYTFILLDQIDGRTWQVQWSMEPKNRGIIPID